MNDSFNLRRHFTLPIIALIVTFVLGSVGYRVFFPDAPWANIFFMTAVTLSTVGYNDVLGARDHPYAIWYTMFLIVLGMGLVLYSVSALTAFFMEGVFQRLLRDRTTLRRISRMQQHYLICGAGKTGIHVVREMYATKLPFVVIESDAERLEELEREMKGLTVITGDATSEEVLQRAGIEKARGLIAVLSNDKDNLFLSLTARMINPQLDIVARAFDPDLHDRLRRAGADHVISPNHIGGLRIVSELLRPHAVAFLDRMLHGQDHAVRAEQVEIPANSPLVNQSLADANIPARTGLVVIAYDPGGNDEFIYNPGRDTKLGAGGVLLVIADPQQLQKLKLLVNG